MQKLLASSMMLTAFFVIFVTLLHYDLTRKITKSLWQLIPGILILVFGIFMNYMLTDPAYVFTHLFPIKSGFARGALSLTLPMIVSAVKTMSIIACLTALIDKMWFFWLNERLAYLVRLFVSIFMGIIAGNTLFKITFSSPKELASSTARLKVLSTWSGTILGIILLLVTIMAIPHIFKKK